MNILIVNLHSALNLGDDAIMKGTLASLYKIYPSARIVAAANDPQSWRKYPELESVNSLCNWIGDCRLGRFRHRMYRMPVYLVLLTLAAVLYRGVRIRLLFGSLEQRRLLAAYYNADMVVSCGGGNFYAHHPRSPALVWALLSLAFGQALGKQTVMLPQSVGPIEGKLQRRLASGILSRVSCLLVREPRSAIFLTQVLKIRRPAVLLPDLAFGLPPSAPIRPDDPADSTVKIGLTIIDRGAQDRQFQRQAAYEKNLQELLEKLGRYKRSEVHIFVQCYGPSPDQDDRHAARRVYQVLQDRLPAVTLHADFTDALAIQAAYRSMDLIIGTRLHTGILALSCGVPAILISYQPKTLGVMELLKLQEYCRDIEQLEAGGLYELACQVLENKSLIRQEFAQAYRQAHDQLRHLRTHLEG